MNALRELKELLSQILPVETGVFSRTAPASIRTLLRDRNEKRYISGKNL